MVPDVSGTRGAVTFLSCLLQLDFCQFTFCGPLTSVWTDTLPVCNRIRMVSRDSLTVVAVEQRRDRGSEAAHFLLCWSTVSSAVVGCALSSWRSSVAVKQLISRLKRGVGGKGVVENVGQQRNGSELVNFSGVGWSYVCVRACVCKRVCMRVRAREIIHECLCKDPNSFFIRLY